MGEAEYVVDIWVVGVDKSVVDGRDRLEVWCCRVGCSEAVGRLWRYILILLIFSCCWSIFLSIFLVKGADCFNYLGLSGIQRFHFGHELG